MKVTDNSTYRLMQTNLDRITNDLLVLRSQGATGLKLNKPSDDPGAIRPVLTTRTQLRQTERYLETMGQASDQITATDGHLSHVENVLVRVKEIAINSVNGALGQSDLAALADEIAELKNELLDTANAVVNGTYIFAGYQQATKPFSVNPDYDPDAYDPGNVATWPYRYHGDNNPTRLEITPGEGIETTLTGNEVFFGITNEIAATGYANPYQGETMTSGPLVPGPFADNITPNSPTDVMIVGASLSDVGLTADTLNGASGRIDLFTILTRTEEAIRAGNVDNINGAGGSIQAQIKNLEIAAKQNRSQRGTLGARAQRIDLAMVHQEDAQINLKQILSRYQDADMLEVFNDITQKETAFQAALNITARISQISILDYF